jgi:AraC-like DNA-binding protein
VIRLDHDLSLDGDATWRWSLRGTECPALAAQHIRHVDLFEARAPFRRVRLNPNGSHIMGCSGGDGRILMDGRWQRCQPGTITLAPPRVTNAFHARGEEPWRICVVRYEEPPGVPPVVNAASPVRVTGRVEDFRRIVDGLRAEWESERDPRALHGWAGLLHNQVRRYARPWKIDERIAAVWAEVQQRLGEDWNVEALASACHTSREHLRRLCLRELGRSPMQHLTSLRMQQARELLESTHDKVEAVAMAIGYDNAQVFCRVFKCWVGVTPSEYRAGGDGGRSRAR